MKKLLVVVFAALVAAGLFAADVSGKVSWSGGITFTAIADEKGIDLKASVGVEVSWSWSPLSDSKTEGKVSAAISWGFNSSGYANLSYISYENDLFKLNYTPSGYKGDIFFANGDTAFGNDKLEVSVKPAGLSFVYVDLVEETDTDTGSPVEFDKYFNDYVAVSGEFGPVSVFGAFYDTTGADTTPAYEYGMAFYVSGGDLFDVLKGLTIKGAFGMPASPTTLAYGVIVEYKPDDMKFGDLTFSFSNTFKYTENLAVLKYNTVTDAKSDSFEAEAAYKMEDFSLSAGINGTYDFVASTFKLGANAGVDGSFEMVSFGLGVKAADLISSPAAVEITGNVGVDVDPVSFSAAGIYKTDTSEYAYNAELTYKFDEALSFCAFYGTYYDKNGDGTKDINMDDPQWYVKMTYSISF